LNIIINKIAEIIGKIIYRMQVIFVYFYAIICYSFRMKELTNSTIDPTEITGKATVLAAQQIQQTLETLQHINPELTTKNAQLEHQLESALQKIKWFEEQFKLSQSRQFAKSSETSASLQAELIFNADEGLSNSSKEVEETAEKEANTYTHRKQKKGRHIDTSILPRRQEIHDLIAEQKICGDCQGPLHKVRDEISEQIEIIPKQLYVVEHIHPQYACRHCVTMTAAEKPCAPIPKGMAGASLITDVIISKYEHHLPLYRQSQIYGGLGSIIPDNTLGHWVMQAGEGITCLDNALQTAIIQAAYLQVDETPVKVLIPERQAYMWVFHSPSRSHRLVRFRFDLSRSGNIAQEELKDYIGLLQTDGYAGYNGVREQSGIIALGCAAHARRKFAEVVKISTTKSPGKAQKALSYFAQLYSLEQQARQEQMDFAERKHLRQTQAIPILLEFEQWLRTSKNQVPPQSTLGKAIDYTLKQWHYLIRYTEHGEAEIDNNWIENQIRPFALGKKNWLFLLHEASAQVAALFYSLIQSAKLNAHNPRIYIHYLLTQIHSLRKKQVNPVDLLPHRISHETLAQFAQREFQKAQSILIPASV
jgi:transposase